ncbi:hypothetical protein PENTCL1PPCAC_22353 [Pristionchus entomophagus]|uniref:Uncharacterized protein n=1 Tax=Pristionchus entomophagus TaxID=358040 RepID=A0AAV5U166_9BILA|nr:hypothetical protein PENTCL1PPCAC_22353 [Pristionchus entomophagus]
MGMNHPHPPSDKLFRLISVSRDMVDVFDEGQKGNAMQMEQSAATIRKRKHEEDTSGEGQIKQIRSFEKEEEAILLSDLTIDERMMIHRIRIARTISLFSLFQLNSSRTLYLSFRRKID